MKYPGLFLVVALVAGQVSAWRINENDSPLEPSGVQHELKKVGDHFDVTGNGDMRETVRHAPDELASRQDNIRASAYDEKLRNFLENLKVVIREGNESLSIPPLDPFEEKLLELDLDEKYVTGSVKFTDFEALGLADYQVDKAEVVLFPPKLTVGLTWPRLYSSASYKLDAVALNKIEVYGEGKYTVTATDLSFETKIFLRLSPLSIKKMETQVSLGGLQFSATGLYNDEDTSMILSNVISDVVPELIQEHHDKVATEINRKVMEFGNKQLEGMTLSDLLNIINSVSSIHTLDETPTLLWSALNEIFGSSSSTGDPQTVRTKLISYQLGSTSVFVDNKESLKALKAPEMLLRVYSLVVLALDLVTLLVGIWFAIVVALYRTFRPPPLKNISGEVAMVVGAGRGVGREIAVQLSQLGVFVACVDIMAENCFATAKRASCYSGMAKPFVCDVTDKEQVKRTVEAIKTEMGDVTMVFHCCGVPSPRALVQDAPEVRKTMEVSVFSHFWLLDSVMPGMQRAGRGHIVALSSVAGLSGGASSGGRVPISTAQFAVQGFAESLHTEFRHSNSNIIITLVHVYPFIVGAEAAKDIRFRIPSYFGTMPATDAAKKILDGVRRNYAEFSVPGYLLYLGHVLRILPKKASFMLRDLLDTGVDFG